jgi:hypothetical protein
MRVDVKDAVNAFRKFSFFGGSEKWNSSQNPFWLFKVTSPYCVTGILWLSALRLSRLPSLLALVHVRPITFESGGTPSSSWNGSNVAVPVTSWYSMTENASLSTLYRMKPDKGKSYHPSRFEDVAPSAPTKPVRSLEICSGLSIDSEDIEHLVDETDFVLHVRLARQAMTSADHAHDFEALDRSGRRLYGLKASRRSNDAFESTVVGLDDVVEILARAMLCVGRHCSFSLQPGDGFGIGSELVCRDRGR